MAYTPTEWANREVEKPRTYIMTDNGDGTITLTPSEGQIFAPGTPLDATNLNKIEQQIASNTDNIETRVSKSGDVMTGTFTGTVYKRQNEPYKRTEPIFRPNTRRKEIMRLQGQYGTWEYDPNGCSLVVGKFANSERQTD